MSCCGGSVPGDMVCKAGEDTERRLAEQGLRHASRELEDGLRQIDFLVPDMHCASCISAIERGLAREESVARVRANLSNRRVSVVWDPGMGDARDIQTALTGLGYANTVFDVGDQASEQLAQRSRQLLLALAVAGFAAANIMLLSVSVWSGADEETASLFHLISGLIAVPAVAFAGRPFFNSALSALSARRLNMDVPISLAVLLALGMSIHESLTGGAEAYFDASVTLLFFLLIGRYLDQLMRQKARGAVERLGSISARGAVLVDATGDTRYIPLAEIETGMRLRVLPGERLPVDGIVIEGHADIDRSLVTGESESQHAGPGMRIEAGVMSLTGAIDIEAVTTARNSFLAEIMAMMEAAEHGRGRYVQIAERMAAIYAPAVHLLALVTFIAWMIVTSANWHASIYAAIAVLIITCPCALGLAVPVVHVIGANRLFREGILIRDGSAFERLAEIDTIVFDKTGTLTTGSPRIRETDNAPARDVSVMVALARRSSHPAARALAARHHDIAPDSASQFRIDSVREVPGFGVEAELDGKRIRLGRPAWVGEIASPDSLPEGLSLAFAREGSRISGFVLQDDLREGAVTAIKRLRKDGLAIEIMSGDNQAAVSAIADQLGIGHARAGVTPQEKIGRVTELQSQGHRVLMVGDGLNDAPALAAGHVSMAPASASEIGRLASDFVFTRPSLDAVPHALHIARRTGTLVRQNFGLAIAYNCIAVPLAMGGYVTPLIAAIAMSASSIVVVANSMRLNFGGFGVHAGRAVPGSRTTWTGKGLRHA